MQETVKQSTDIIRLSVNFFAPELALTIGVLLVIIAGLIWRKQDATLHLLTLFALIATTTLVMTTWTTDPVSLFMGMVRTDDFSSYLKLLFATSGILTVVMTWMNETRQQRLSEFYALVLAIVLGANLLVMSTNFVTAFLALELISISSYALTGFAFSRQSTEGSLKYFLFGSVASAVMVYGISLLYGLTGTLEFTSQQFYSALVQQPEGVFLVAGSLTLAGFVFKVGAAPLHPWAPDVYEASPMPVVAFFAAVPKLAGIGILTKFILTLNLYGQSPIDWQLILSLIAILTLAIGNFSALGQKNPKRLMAYSSIAQSGFLLTGVVSFSPQGIHFLLFYATIYVVLNFLVFILLQTFENRGMTTIASYAGAGKVFLWPSVFLVVAMIGLTGLPPTAGFTGKLFIFSALWESYSFSGKTVLLVLLIFGLLNTVIALFYYLRIPYFAFIKNPEQTFPSKNLTFENLLAFVLVLVVLLFFFSPQLLMGWINKITFVL